MEVNKIDNFEFKMIGKGYKSRSKRTMQNNLFCNWNNITNKEEFDKILNKVFIKNEYITEKVI
jgi:hypothetical protein